MNQFHVAYFQKRADLGRPAASDLLPMTGAGPWLADYVATDAGANRSGRAHAMASSIGRSEEEIPFRVRNPMTSGFLNTFAGMGVGGLVGAGLGGALGSMVSTGEGRSGAADGAGAGLGAGMAIGAITQFIRNNIKRRADMRNISADFDNPANTITPKANPVTTSVAEDVLLPYSGFANKGERDTHRYLSGQSDTPPSFDAVNGAGMTLSRLPYIGAPAAIASGITENLRSRKTAAPAVGPISEFVSKAVKALSGQTAQTAAGAAGAVGAAHYGGGLDWQDSAPFALAGAGLGNRSFRNWAVAKDITDASRFNVATNRIIGAAAVKGGIPIGLAVGRHLPATLESVRGAAKNVQTVTDQAAQGDLGKSLADTGKGLSAASTLAAGTANNLHTMTKNLNDPNKPMADPFGLAPVTKSLESLANTGERVVNLGERAGHKLNEVGGRAVQSLKDNAKPIGYGAAAIGGGLVLAKLLDVATRNRPAAPAPTKKKQPTD